ncbi:MAG: hypothetical protein ACRDMU_04390 [Gaiellaceae bacterium]
MTGRAGLWATVVLSAATAVLGLVLIVETALVDGSLGFLVGVLFLAAGSLRLLLMLRSR